MAVLHPETDEAKKIAFQGKGRYKLRGETFLANLGFEEQEVKIRAFTMNIKGKQCVVLYEKDASLKA
jgi:hypothetical protein